ncbi:MAG: ABC transporter ATP-binding protein [Anaerolineae bacterium]
MSADSAIRVEHLSKLYRIGRRERYRTLRDTLSGAMAAPFRAMASLVKARRSAERSEPNNTIWALKDVSFEVKRGEVVGIIGRNGAGKSTLLKILSHVTEPTDGYAEICGRVGSLLEVGTGFHPELTGRENIYLNGAILGMKRAEIHQRFNEIVTFAEIDKFLDTPVKHYSSGMQTRLAFAIAAHLEPEIMVIDEVLAVGDAAFQKKCLGKIGGVAKEGRTTLFVSHNMAAVSNLCSRAIMLDAGGIVASGEPQRVIERYVRSMETDSISSLSLRKDRKGKGRVCFTRMSFEDKDGNLVQSGISGEPLAVALEYESDEERILPNCRISVAVYDIWWQFLFNCSTELTSSAISSLPSRGRVRCVIPRLPLCEGQYFVSPFFEVNREVEDWIQGASTLNVVNGDFFGTGRVYPWGGKGVLVPHSWVVDS